MNGDLKTPDNRDDLLDAFAAELTVAAYHVALRHSVGVRWVDLELDLWRALTDTVKTWGEGVVSAPLAGEAAFTVQCR